MAKRSKPWAIPPPRNLSKMAEEDPLQLSPPTNAPKRTRSSSCPRQTFAVRWLFGRTTVLPHVLPLLSTGPVNPKRRIVLDFSELRVRNQKKDLLPPNTPPTLASPTKRRMCWISSLNAPNCFWFLARITFNAKNNPVSRNANGAVEDVVKNVGRTQCVRPTFSTTSPSAPLALRTQSPEGCCSSTTPNSFAPI